MLRNHRKKPGQIRLHLSPQHGGAFTRWRLTGSLVTPVAHRDLCLLFQKLSFWSGWPVELVLPVGVGEGAWFDWWTTVIDRTRADHLRVRFDLKAHKP